MALLRAMTGGILSELLAHSKAMHARHDKVQNNEVGFLRFGNGHTIKPVVRLENSKSLVYEVMRIETAQKIFVVNEKDFKAQEYSVNMRALKTFGRIAIGDLEPRLPAYSKNRSEGYVKKYVLVCRNAI